MGFLIPNAADAVFANQEEAQLSSVSLSILAEAFDRTGVVRGIGSECAATKNATIRTWNIAAGAVRHQGRRYEVTATTVQNAVHSGGAYSRWDIIVYDTGSLACAIVQGSEAAENPVYPVIASDQVALYAVFIPTGLTGGQDFPVSPATVASEHLVDQRVLIREPAGLYNVKDFGAVGDDSTDDYAAIQAAMDQAASDAGGGAEETAYLGAGVYFPPGRYLTSDEITIPDIGFRIAGFTVLGAGATVTSIKPHSTFGSTVTQRGRGGAFLMRTSADEGVKKWQSWITIQGLQFGSIRGESGGILGGYTYVFNAGDGGDNGTRDGTGGLPLIGGLDLYGAEGNTLREVTINDLTGFAILACSDQESLWENVRIGLCGTAGDVFASAASGSTVTIIKAMNRTWATDCWKNMKVLCRVGANAGTVRQIVSNTADTITVNVGWSTPADREEYIIICSGVADGGSATTIQMGASATPGTAAWATDMFKGWMVTILAGTGKYQTAFVSSNTATTLTLDRTLGTAAASGSKFVIYKPCVGFAQRASGDGATNNSKFSNCTITGNYGPMVAAYSAYPSSLTVDHYFWTNSFFHSHTTSTQGWPFDLVYVENARYWSFINGRMSGPKGSDAILSGVKAGSFAFAGREANNNYHNIEGMIFTTAGDANAYGIRFLKDGSSSCGQHHIGTNAWYGISLDACVYIEADAPYETERTQIERQAFDNEHFESVVASASTGFVKTKSKTYIAPNLSDSGVTESADNRVAYTLLDAQGEKARVWGDIPDDYQQVIAVDWILSTGSATPDPIDVNLSMDLIRTGTIDTGVYSNSDATATWANPGVDYISALDASSLWSFAVIKPGDMFAAMLEDDETSAHSIRVVGLRLRYI